MALIEWRKEFETGFSGVDYEHRQLIGLINELHASLLDEGSKEATLRFFGDLHGNISAHFALEEKMMREANYDEYAAHKAEHEHLLDEIRDIMDGYEAGAYPDYREVLAERLKAWFLDHFSTTDTRLHRMIG